MDDNNTDFDIDDDDPDAAGCQMGAQLVLSSPRAGLDS